MKAISMFKREAVECRMWIPEMTGCVHSVLELEMSEDSESDAIKKDGMGGFSMVARQSKMAYSSVINMEAGFLCLYMYELSPIVNAYPVLL